MAPQYGRSVVQDLVVSVVLRVVTYEAMTPQFGWSVVQILNVRVDIGGSYDIPLCEVSGSGPGSQSGYRSGDL